MPIAILITSTSLHSWLTESSSQDAEVSEAEGVADPTLEEAGEALPEADMQGVGGKTDALEEGSAALEAGRNPSRAGNPLHSPGQQSAAPLRSICKDNLKGLYPPRIPSLLSNLGLWAAVAPQSSVHTFFTCSC